MSFSKSVIISPILIPILLIFSSKISGLDFWWHLKTGEYIWEIKGLPDEDPFSYTPSQTDRAGFILRQYWLAQLVYYFIYNHIGPNGIICLRIFIFLIIAYLIYKRIGENPFSLGWVLLTLGIFIDFKEDKPQLFSFLFFTVLIYLISWKDNPKIRFPFLVPLLISLWSNMHGGFVLGVLILLIYGGFAFIDGRLSKKEGGIILISLFLSFLNPNGIKIIPFILNLHKSIFTKEVVEYYPAFKYMKYSSTHLIFYWMAFVSILFMGIKEFNPYRLVNLLFILLGALSLFWIKYIPFFVLATPIFWEFHPFNKHNWAIIPVMLILPLIIWMGIRYRSFPDIFPSYGIRFVKGIKGNIFNEYNIGGYLIWKLYPQKRVFIDTRGLSDKVFLDYRSIMDGKGYNKLLRRYRVELIITPACNYISGNLYPLIPKIMNDKEWVLIYMDGKVLVFIKNSKENLEFIKRYRIPKERVYDEIIMEAKRGIDRNGRISGFYASLGYGLVGKGKYKMARTAYEKAFRLNPADKSLLEMLNILRSMNY